MTLRRSLVTLACVVLVGVIAVGVTKLPGGSSGGGQRERLTAAQTSALLADSPAPLAVLHEQAGELLGGGGGAFRARMKALRGYPVVINKWASWCGPCKAEFGLFQRVSARLGRRVAFLGVDSGDSSRSEALAFLRSHPVSYPSYYDEHGKLGEQVSYSWSTPVTVFVAADGRRFPRQGQYLSAAKLEADVRRYALEA